MASKIVIEENTIYEIDEECIKKMEQQRIALEEKNKKANKNVPSNRRSGGYQR